MGLRGAKISRNKETLFEKGSPDDHYRRHTMDSCYVGESIGFTINEGDFNSLRIDVWGTEEVPPGGTRSNAFEILSKDLDTEARRLIKEYEK